MAELALAREAASVATQSILPLLLEYTLLRKNLENPREQICKLQLAWRPGPGLPSQGYLTPFIVSSSMALGSPWVTAIPHTALRPWRASSSHLHALR